MLADDLLSPSPPRIKEYWEHPDTHDATNPMRWSCERSGCFNTVKRPKIEDFARCFPRNCQMADIDGEVEVNSHWLRLEWKPAPDEEFLAHHLSTGQLINYTRLTLHCPRHVVFVVWGDAERMTVSRLDKFQGGVRYGDWGQVRSLDMLRMEMRLWAQSVEKL